MTASDPGLRRSWVAGANAGDCPFPLNNLPFGVFSGGGPARCGVAIGGAVLDLAALQSAGLLPAACFDEAALNGFMALGPACWQEVRETLTALLSEGAAGEDRVAAHLYPLDSVRMHLPFRVAGYTDFYAGRQHAFNVGSLFRGPENALPPNWLHIPIGYNGRASTVVVSGTPVTRPNGQLRPKGSDAPRFGPSERLDIELELGAVVGQPSELGRPVSVAEAEEMIFGYVLLNDWSARDIQAWEYQPLGPFQGKAFATTISPWVVTRAALAPFRRPTPPREVPLLPYLLEDGPSLYDIDLAVELQPAGAERGRTISRTNAGELYYSAAQQLAHHASSGCRMEVGDLLGSGTISGPGPDSYGSLLELTWGGERPLQIDGATRTFLADGDRVTLSGRVQGKGYCLGFGPCTGTILPAPDFLN